MVDNEPNIYISVNKTIKTMKAIKTIKASFWDAFSEKNMAPRENPPMTHFGAIKMKRNIWNIFFCNSILQKEIPILDFNLYLKQIIKCFDFPKI